MDSPKFFRHMRLFKETLDNISEKHSLIHMHIIQMSHIIDGEMDVYTENGTCRMSDS